MNDTTPEKMGIHSSQIQEYIESLEQANLSTHDLIIARHGNILFEAYWKPFDRNFRHRMYSVTKSFVALAIGFLEQDGFIGLDDPIVRYFPKELAESNNTYLKAQTIRHMLMMSTSQMGRDWFKARPSDRVQFYFDCAPKESRPSGTFFRYDSTGTFILGALVERITGRSLKDYLREKLFDKIGISENAGFLNCPGGHSWGDSALLCTPLDLLKTAQFCMDKGRWNGKQILNETFVTAATSKQIDNSLAGLNKHDTQGYGYQFWMTYDNSFIFSGMGCQFAICIPDKDLIMVYNGDNQGNDIADAIIIDNFFRLVARKAADGELPEHPAAHRMLLDYAGTLKLFAAKGQRHSDFEKEIHNVTYLMQENAMGITKMRFHFDGSQGTLYYTNAQGDKELPFGMCENVFGDFPQYGYSDMTGSIPGDRLYRCAASAAWVEERKLFLKVQIIDTYFGNLNMTFGFREDKSLGVFMSKAAEDFLNEYEGAAVGAPLHNAS